MEWCAPVLIDAVNVCTVHKQCLDHLDLSRALIEDGVVERGASGMICHMDQVGTVSAQYGKDLHRGYLTRRAASEV